MKNHDISTSHPTSHQDKSLTETIAAELQCGVPDCPCALEKEHGWSTHCPAHNDENPSLSLSEGEDGKVLVYCHAGCSQEEVIAALQELDLWPTKHKPQGYKPRGKLEIAYGYRDENGHLLFQACRYEPKRFYLRRLDGMGGWEYKVKGTRLVPYKLPEILKADQVIIVEGEKDVCNLMDLGLTASCNPMGAGKWQKEYNVHFKGKQIIILPDNDEVGRRHAQQVAKNLYGIATSIKVLELPGLPEKGDVSDWLAAGNTANDLLALAEAAPEWSPPASSKNGSRTQKKGKASQKHADKADDGPVLTLVREVLPDAPVPAGALVPEGYYLTAEGLWMESIKKGGPEHILIASTPIFIAGRLYSISDGTENVRLAWWRDGEWRQVTVERASIASRSITDLANLGLPVTTVNATHLIKYLAAFEALNLGCLPRTQVSQTLGWQGQEGDLGFLWGRTLLPLDFQQGDSMNSVAFRGADQGDEQIAEAFTSKGSLADWIEAIRGVVEFPRVILSVYAALTPPLLTIFDCLNFIDYCNQTSTGKTIVLRLGASCWGVPDERSPASVLQTWDATRVFIGRTSSLLNSLPLILDDTKRCKKSAEIAKVLYDVTSGRDRGRGSTKSLRLSGSWRTVMLSSGEAPATSFTQDGGTRARVLKLWGPPFGRADDTTAPLVHRLNQTILQNYGHAGPRFVEFLISRKTDWPAWREQYQKTQAGYLEKAGRNPVVGRLCGYFAALDMAAGIAHAALELPWSYRDPIEALWNDLVSGAEEADVASRALITVMSWARGNQANFYGRQGD